MKPRLLDLFAGAGGCSVGYDRAGFDVMGVDIEPHPDYPFALIVEDAIEFLAKSSPGYLAKFDVIHASPPCQAHTTMSNRWRGKGGRADEHVNLIGEVRDVLEQWGGPYVIENVPGARRELRHPITLHGGMFGLRVHRPRLFECNWPAMTYTAPPPVNPVGVYGKSADGRRLFTRADGTEQRAASSLEEADRDGLRVDDRLPRRRRGGAACLHRILRRAIAGILVLCRGRCVSWRIVKLQWSAAACAISTTRGCGTVGRLSRIAGRAGSPAFVRSTGATGKLRTPNGCCAAFISSDSFGEATRTKSSGHETHTSTDAATAGCASKGSDKGSSSTAWSWPSTSAAPSGLTKACTTKTGSRRTTASRTLNFGFALNPRAAGSRTPLRGPRRFSGATTAEYLGRQLLEQIERAAA